MAEDIEGRLRRRREDLIARFDRIDDPDSLWFFEKRLADEIIAAEPTAYADRESPEREHLRHMRLFGDALAWRSLHPHAIRQLAKNPGPPKALHNQAGFANTMAVAEQACRSGEPALVADLSNCLRIGDVVVCSDPERPRIVECGGRPEFAHRGRKARQRRRAEAIDKLLGEGTAVLSGDTLTTSTIELGTGVAADFTYSAVEKAMEDALAGGDGISCADPGDVVVACQDDQMSAIAAAFERFFDRSRPICFGLHLRLLEQPNEHHAPPHVWPISRCHRVALIEGDLTLAHVVDLDRFKGEALSLGRISKVRFGGGEVRGFVVEAGGIELDMSPRFLNDVLYGYQAIESARETMVAAAVAVVDSEGLAEAAGKAVRAESAKQAADLIAKHEAGQTPDFVSLPLELFHWLQSRSADDE